MNSGRSVTQVEIARKLKVSQKTVSRVFNEYPLVNEKTRKRVLHELRKNGYVPNQSARNLVTGRQSAIGILMPGEYTLRQIYFNETLGGIIEQVNAEGRELIFHSVAEIQDATSIRDFNVFLHRVDGLIIFNMGSEKEVVPKIMSAINNSAKSYILIGSGPFERHQWYATVDNHHGGYLAGRQFVLLGHKTLSVVKQENYSSWEYEQREKGFLLALDEAGIPFRDRNVLTYSGTILAPVAEKILSMDDHERPTGFFSLNDHAARVLTIELEKRGASVPRDFSVIGFNDVIRETEMMHPYLTTIRQPFRALGIYSVKAVLESQEDDVSKQIIIKPELVIRESTARPQAQSPRKGSWRS